MVQSGSSTLMFAMPLVLQTQERPLTSFPLMKKNVIEGREFNDSHELFLTIISEFGLKVVGIGAS